MFEGIDPSIGSLLEKFVEKPDCLSHLLFLGPPGSGKTTTAFNLVKAFYPGRKHYTGKALFLNSSDERSLEAVRSKVYPFARSEIHTLFHQDFFVKKAPKIIIFDESTSSLDHKSDGVIQECFQINFKDTTVISIAHRLNTIIGFDRVLVLEQGKIAEFDSPKCLLQSNDSLFSQMAQASGSNNYELLKAAVSPE
jgi:ABC-type multidrug transport system ATPase subunit